MAVVREKKPEPEAITDRVERFHKDLDSKIETLASSVNDKLGRIAEILEDMNTKLDLAITEPEHESQDAKEQK